MPGCFFVIFEPEERPGCGAIVNDVGKKHRKNYFNKAVNFEILFLVLRVCHEIV